MQTVTLDALQAAVTYLAVLLVMGVLIGLVFYFVNKSNKYRDELHEQALKRLERKLKKDLAKDLREILNEKNSDS